MTIAVDWSYDPDDRPVGQRQFFYSSMNFVQEFVQDMGGIGIFSNMANNAPKLDGITAWADKKYRISVVDRYVTRIESHACLGPHPMEKLGRTGFNNPIYIPYDAISASWGDYTHSPTKDELRVFMDPVFVGPRSPADRKFFHSQAIKIGLRKKIGPRHRAYDQCQTPELRRWQEDTEASRLMFADQGGVLATEWATERGWQEAKFWSTEHLDIKSIDITMPGCEGKPDTYEKLLFVMKFSGRVW